MIEIPAAGSVRYDLDARTMQPGQWATLDNVDFAISGRFRLRQPMATTVNTANVGAGPVDAISSGALPWARAGHTLLVSSSATGLALDELSGTNNGLRVTQATTAYHAVPSGISGTDYEWCDGASNTIFGVEVCATASYRNGSFTVTVFDPISGNTLQTFPSISSGGSGDGTPQIAWYQTDSTELLLTVRDGGFIYGLVLDISTGNTTTPSLTSIFAGGQSIALCSATIGSDNYIVCAYRSSAVAIQVIQWDTATDAWTATRYTQATTAPTYQTITLSCYQPASGQLGILLGYIDGSTSRIRDVTFTASAGTLSGSSLVGSIALATANPYGIAAAYGDVLAGDTTGVVWWSFAGIAEPTVTAYTFTRGTYTTSSRWSSIGAIASQPCTLRTARSPSASYYYSPCIAVALWDGDTPTSGRIAVFAGIDSELCSTGFGLVEGNGVGIVDRTHSHLGPAYEVSKALCYPLQRDVAEAPAVVPVLLAEGVPDSQFPPESVGSHATMGQVTLFAGGMCRFDGRKIAPPIPAGIPSITAEYDTVGGTIPAGTYGIAIVYEWYDADGYRYQSAPAVRTVTTTGATSSIDWTVDALGRSTTGAYERTVAVYMTLDAGTTYYRQDVASATSGTITFVPVGTTEILYTIAEPPHIEPGSAQCVAVADSRWWAADGTRVYYSHRAEGGNAAQFAAGALYLDAPERIHGIGELDEQPLLLGESRIYRVVGDGPDRTGGGGVYLVQPISGALGMIPGTPVLSSTVGVWYETRRGLTLLARGGGAPVLQTAIEMSALTGAVEMPNEEMVVFAGSVNGTLAAACYDIRTGAWSRWTPPYWRTVGSWRSSLLAGSEGYVYQQSSGSTDYRDASGLSPGNLFAYTLIAETGDLRPAGTAAPVQWGTVSALTGSVGTSATLSTTIRVDSDAGTVTATAQTASVTADRQKVRVQPQYASADAISVRWEITPVSGQAADWCGASIEATPQGGSTRVPSARSR